MNSDRDKIDFFSSVNPYAVQKYLLETDWQEKQGVDPRCVVLSNKRGERKFLIMLPLEADVPDFSTRMCEVFKTLEAFEQRQQLRILSDFC